MFINSYLKCYAEISVDLSIYRCVVLGEFGSVNKNLLTFNGWV